MTKKSILLVFIVVIFCLFRVFPYKIRVTEDKVARDLFNLQLSPPNHFQRRQRTISEIESRYCTVYN